MAEKQVARIELQLVSANTVFTAFWNKMGFKTFAEKVSALVGPDENRPHHKGQGNRPEQ